MKSQLYFLTWAVMGLTICMLSAEDFDRDGLDDTWKASHGFATNGYASANLVGWWQLDEECPTNVVDRTANNRPGTFTDFAASPSVTGLFSNALAFASNSHVQFEPSLALNVTNQFTVSCWVAATNTVERTVLIQWHDDGVQGWTLALHPDGAARLEFIGTDGNVQTVGGGAQSLNIRDNEWHHLAGVFDTVTTTVTLYVDGGAEATGTITNWAPSQVQSFILGNSQSGNPPSATRPENFRDSQFLLDEVRLYNIALPLEGILQLPCTYSDPDGSGMTNLQRYLLDTQSK